MSDSVYTRIIEKMNARQSKRLTAIFEASFTPEEGELFLELFAPATAREVADRLKKNEKNVAKKLDELVARGFLTKGETQYAFHTSLLAYHHDVVGDPAVEPVPEKIKELWADFFYNEWYQDFVDGYIKRQAASGRPVHRVWPAIGALELSPGIPRDQILPAENFLLTIQNGKRRIMANCGCRNLWGKCEHPVMTCFACFDNSRGEYYLGKPGRTLKEVSLQECLDIVHDAEKAGLVHIGVCYCCPDACEILYSTTRTNRLDLVGASRYLAVVDEAQCTGCQQCLDRCYFNAIEMQKVPGSKKLKAFIVKENCKGCGLCVVNCEQRALTLKIDKPPEFILGNTPVQTNVDLRRFSPWGFYDLK